MFSKIPRNIKFAVTKLRDDEVPTQPHLAFDLSAMDELREHGVPISSATLAGDYFDGTVGNDINVAFENKRFTDINDAWNHSKDASSVLSKSKIKSVEHTLTT